MQSHADFREDHINAFVCDVSSSDLYDIIKPSSIDVVTLVSVRGKSKSQCSSSHMCCKHLEYKPMCVFISCVVSILLLLKTYGLSKWDTYV